MFYLADKTIDSAQDADSGILLRNCSKEVGVKPGHIRVFVTKSGQLECQKIIAN